MTGTALVKPQHEDVSGRVQDGPVRDRWVTAGMLVSAASAAVASFSGLYGLAVFAGWPLRLAWLLPLTVDAYAMTSARVWLARTTESDAARGFARINALLAITASITGNSVYHAISTGLLPMSWPVVVLVGAVPAAVLGLTAHLHALRGHPEPSPPVPTAPHQDEETSLLAAARAADAAYRTEHGRPITRDALRSRLRISTRKATELRRRLSAENEGGDA
ncbi:uncharacterized protein DUF2637 [Actinocorallia herbida]|uniref:Uncharacterized protein DUF2637 n=1 Tax=Actinocorallia herbida TaxID=58109 RepID=A0A3N1D7S4_9ACTN|nr:DUF2637 domain-containing protein [Actinocorallia herbida]ROO89574.1 uncharacterized protein DUF2637 [Actinocorallia herbida]